MSYSLDTHVQYFKSVLVKLWVSSFSTRLLSFCRVTIKNLQPLAALVGLKGFKMVQDLYYKNSVWSWIIKCNPFFKNSMAFCLVTRRLDRHNGHTASLARYVSLSSQKSQKNFWVLLWLTRPSVTILCSSTLNQSPLSGLI